LGHYVVCNNGKQLRVISAAFNDVRLTLNFALSGENLTMCY